MAPEQVLVTAALLGGYVLCGGAYGVCYAIKDVHGWTVCGALSRAAYALQSGLALALIVWTPLGIGWKLLLAASTAAYAAIPSVTLRYLRSIHTG